MQVAEIQCGIKHYGVNKRIKKNNLVLVIMLCGFQKAISHT
jgi:putative component of toxin-antitoxin plasmid stabilization module